jgi:hypothetical protein
MLQPRVLWQHRMRDAESRRDRAWWIERDAEANHHTAIDVDRQCDPRAPDRQALFPIDHDDVEFGVIDLDDVQRALRRVERTSSRCKAIGGLFAMRTAPQPFNRSRIGRARMRSRTVFGFGACRLASRQRRATSCAVERTVRC